MLAKQCVEEDPVLRPDMKQAVITLSQILLSSIEWEATLAGNSQVFSGLVAGRWSCVIGGLLLYVLFGNLPSWSTRGIFSYNLLYFYWSLVQLSNFSLASFESIYHNAVYFLVGGIVCTYTRMYSPMQWSCIISFVLPLLQCICPVSLIQGSSWLVIRFGSSLLLGSFFHLLLSRPKYKHVFGPM